MMKKVKFIIAVLLFTTIQLQAQTQKEEFYRTKKGEKYHKKDCKTILEKDTLKISLKEAKKKGFVACKVCEPLKKKPVLEEKKKVNKTKRSSRKSVATQCTGITQKGARCKRRTKSADGTCWQH